MSTDLRMTLLGAVEISWGRNLVKGFNSSKTQALLIYLATTGRPHTRAALAGLLWADLPEIHAQRNLRKSLTNLRQLVGPHLVISRQIVNFALSSSYWLDVEELETTLEDPSTYSSIEALQHAIDLYRGDFLEGFYVRDAPDFEEWVRLEQVRLKNLVIKALHTLLDLYAQHGDGGGVHSLDYASRLLVLDHTREEAHRQMMRLLALSGQRSAALAQYDICRQALIEEFGIEPGEETKKLYAQIRAEDLGATNNTAVDMQRVKPQNDQRSTERDLYSTDFDPGFLKTEENFSTGNAPAIFVAREHELEQLNRFLDLMLAAQGRVVFITGGAGRGKTALLEAFAARAQGKCQALIVATGHCNTFGGIGDPYLPFREILEFLTGDIEARWRSGFLSRDHARRLWLAMEDAIQALVDAGPDLIDIFVPSRGLATHIHAAGPRMSDLADALAALVARKQSTYEAGRLTQRDLFAQYIKVLQLLAQRRPILLVLDDLQWADSGSISLLFDLGRQLRGHQILLVGAYRPDEAAQTDEQQPLEHVVNEFRRLFGQILIDLNQTEEQRFVNAILDSEPNRFSPEFRAAFYRHTKGHALFTIEMLRSMQERGDLVRDYTGLWTESYIRSWDSLPARVEGVIEERILQLPAVQQEMLRIASVEGEQFTAEVIAQVQQVEGRALIRQLSGSLDQRHRLIKSQESQRLGPQVISHFQFRHILFQKYLYNGIDEVERVYLHEAVGNTLEHLYGPHREVIAGELARHFQLAGMDAQAVVYLQTAAEKAVHSYAPQAASAYFHEALALLKRLPETAEHMQQELSLQVSLGNLLIALKGFAATEVEQAFQRARDLCRRLGETPELILVLHGLFRYYFVRANLAMADDLAEQIMQLTRQQSETLLLCPAELSFGLTLTTRGEFAAGVAYLDRAVAAYDSQRHMEYFRRFGQSPLTVSLSQKALALWYLGYPDQAQQISRLAVAFAQEFSHPFSLAATLCWAAWVHQLRREPELTQSYITALDQLTADVEIPYFEAIAATLSGWATIELGNRTRGSMEIRQGLAAYQSTGAMYQASYQQSLLAEAYGESGQIDEGLVILTEAMATIERTDERHYEAEMLRIQGELLNIKGNRINAEQFFIKAIAVARRQQARSLELRACMSLCRLRQGHERESDTYQELAVLYNWFTEGFETLDLKEAKRLLDEFEKPNATS
jgi:DNA-binding SARP family transcriptional activator